MSRALWVLVIWCACSTTPVLAQAPSGRTEVALGGRWLLGHGVSSPDAELTTPSGGQMTLFNTRSDMGNTLAFEGRVGVRLTSRLWVAFAGTIGTTSLQTRVSDDVEVLTDDEASEGVSEFTAGGVLLVELGRRPRRGRTVPIAFVGADFVRDVHEEQHLAESGLLIHAGLGLDYHLGAFATAAPTPGRPRSLKDMALRFEGRLSVRSGGAVPDDEMHLTPGVSVLLVMRY